MSILVLFVDLTKAFDKVVREPVFGWGPRPPADREGYLRELGVSEAAAAWMIGYIDERGHLLQQWKVDAGAADPCHSLHAGSWFRVARVDKKASTKPGGRQGCNLGAFTFNSVYAIALDALV